MSSAVLYLAIVAVWGIVLVPMWLRRDGDGIGRLLHRRTDAEPLDEQVEQVHEQVDDEGPAVDEEPADDGQVHDVVAYAEPLDSAAPARPPASARRRRATRGAVIARRRRRTLGLSLLTITAIVTTTTQVTPWWFVIPPALLLVGHLTLLRVAVSIDHARREEQRRAAAARAARLRHARDERAAREAREAEEAARSAEVIELPAWAREEVYDQYTDRRAVGD
jgi:hypothetical protein